MTHDEFNAAQAHGFIGLYGHDALRVRLSRWTKSGVRVKFLDFDKQGDRDGAKLGRYQWQLVHPDGLSATTRLW